MTVTNSRKRQWIAFGINPSRFIGATYSTRCFALAKVSGDKRPMVTIHVWIATVWVNLPWDHSDERVG